MEILRAIPWWIWFMLSVVPYAITRRKTVHMQVLTLMALCWKFSFSYQKRETTWSFSLLWLEQLQRNRSLRKLLTSTWIRLIQEWVKQIASKGK